MINWPFLNDSEVPIIMCFISVESWHNVNNTGNFEIYWAIKGSKNIKKKFPILLKKNCSDKLSKIIHSQTPPANFSTKVKKINTHRSWANYQKITNQAKNFSDSWPFTGLKGKRINFDQLIHQTNNTQSGVRPPLISIITKLWNIRAKSWREKNWVLSIGWWLHCFLDTLLPNCFL